jgi:hypothetical protein
MQLFGKHVDKGLILGYLEIVGCMVLFL